MRQSLLLFAVLGICGLLLREARGQEGEESRENPVGRKVTVILKDGTKIEGVILGYRNRVYQVKVGDEVKEVPEREVLLLLFDREARKSEEVPEPVRIDVHAGPQGFRIGEEERDVPISAVVDALQASAKKAPKESVVPAGRHPGRSIVVFRFRQALPGRTWITLVDQTYQGMGQEGIDKATRTLRDQAVFEILSKGIAGLDAREVILSIDPNAPAKWFFRVFKACQRTGFTKFMIKWDISGRPDWKTGFSVEGRTFRLARVLVNLAMVPETPWARVLEILWACSRIGIRNVDLLGKSGEIAGIRLPLWDGTPTTSTVLRIGMPGEKEILASTIEDLVAGLRKGDREEAEKTMEELTWIGKEAIPALEKAVESGTPEAKARIETVLKRIREEDSPREADPETVSGAFTGRIGGRKKLRALGGSRHSESVVIMGLIWLKNHQNPDGMWSCPDFRMNCRGGGCGGGGSTADHDMGVTGLSVLAFLGAGHTHRYGKFRNTVRAALKAMKDGQSPEGRFGPKTADGRWIYNHAICTQALAEAYGMNEKSPLLREMAQKAVDFLVDCQNPYLGWRYGRQTGENDTSCTAWAVAALKSAEMSGLKVPRESFEGALNWFNKVTDGAYYKTGYTSKGDTGNRPQDDMGKFQSTHTMTAGAVLSRILILEKKARKLPVVLGGGNLVMQNPPRWDPEGSTIDMYYWYWGTQACFQLGRQYWKAWNEPMKNALIPTQKREGCENGSWDPVGAWGTAGGRVYATAINTLTLEVYYRYGRIPRVR